MPERILIIGANGLSGHALIRALRRRDVEVRALTTNEKSGQTLLDIGAADIAIGNMRDAEDLAVAMTGVDKVYHICPRMQPDELEIGQKVIAAAQQAGIRHLVYHSVIHPNIKPIVFHWDKMKVEAALLTSGLAYTCIQPTNYFQNVAWTWAEIAGGGVYRLPYDADKQLTWVDAEDVGEAAATVLTEPGHEGAAYCLCGPDGPLTRRDICGMLADVLGRDVRAETIDLDAFLGHERYAHRPEGEMVRLRTMFEFYDRHGLPFGNDWTLTNLLGRNPKDYRTFLGEFARDQGE